MRYRHVYRFCLPIISLFRITQGEVITHNFTVASRVYSRKVHSTPCCFMPANLSPPSFLLSRDAPGIVCMRRCIISVQVRLRIIVSPEFLVGDPGTEVLSYCSLLEGTCAIFSSLGRILHEKWVNGGLKFTDTCYLSSYT